jgi:hypothetical protein
MRGSTLAEGEFLKLLVAVLQKCSFARREDPKKQTRQKQNNEETK